MVLCAYCKKADLPTLRGLQSHIAQTPACREARLRHVERNAARGSVAVVFAEHSAIPEMVEPIEDHEMMVADACGNPLTISASLHDQAGLSNPDSEPRINPRRVTVEEVEDIEAGGLPRKPSIGEFPRRATNVL